MAKHANKYFNRSVASRMKEVMYSFFLSFRQANKKYYDKMENI